MASAKLVEEGNLEPSSAPALPSDRKDDSSPDVPKDGDSKVGLKQGASSSIDPQQVQVSVPPTGKMVLEKEQTRQESGYENPKIKDSNGLSHEKDASVPASNNIKPTDSHEPVAANPQTTNHQDTSDGQPPQDASVPQSNNIKPTDTHESVAINPQTKTVHDTSDGLPPLKQDTSVPSSNIAKSVDSQKEESKLSPSVAEANSNRVSKQQEKKDPERVQENHISDESVPQQDASLASTAKPEILDSKRNDVVESTRSPTSEAKPNRSLGSSQEDGSARSEQAQANDVGTRSALPRQVKQTISHHHRRPSDVVSRAMASAAMGTASPSSDVKQTIVHHHRKSSDDVSRALAAAAIDTAAPIESVKDAVSKFGGITNWKAHKVQTVERRKLIEEELEKVQDEIPVLKKQSEAAEESKKQVLKELDSTKRLIEELKLNLERAQMEEHQAKQDCELAQLRVEEMEQGIADEASVAAKAQFEVTKARQLAVVSDLESLKNELETLRKDYASLTSDRDTAITNAEEAVSAAKKVERTVEKLTIELMSTKESLESAHAAHLEAEEHRTGAAMAQEQDIVNQMKELKQAEEEMEKLNQQILSAKDLKSKLDTASALLLDLKAELAAYMALNHNPETAENSKGNLEGQEKNTHRDIQAAIASANRDHEEVKLNIEKATEEIKLLKEAATSLKSHLESEKSALDTVKQKEGMASVTVASIEAELNRTKAEISLVKMKEREAREKMVDLPKQIKKAAEEADQAKSLARVAREELQKAMEEVDQVKARISTTESKILAAQKEIEAAKASEKLALATLNALQETEAAKTPNDEDSPTSPILSLEEYYDLNKKAHEAEVQANRRVTEALSHIEVAKESELRSLSKLEEATFELATKKEALAMARQKAETANEAKLSIEQELRKWRAEHEQQRRSNEPTPGTVTQDRSTRPSSEGRKGSANPNDNSVADAQSRKTDQVPDAVAERSPKEASNTETDTSELKSAKKKKKSIFPRFFMFLGRKKSHHHHHKGH